MLRYRDMSIRLKLTLLIAGTAAVTVLFTAGVDVERSMRSAHVSTQRRLSSLAEVIGENCAAALVFDDRSAADELLSSLAREPLVAGAGVYDTKGRLFASFVAEGQATTWAQRSQGEASTPGFVDASAVIREAGQPLGTIVIRASLSQVQASAYHSLETAGLVVVAALVGAMLLGVRLQRIISDPILRLADITRSVSQEGDYSVRVTKENDDEIGVLYDEFNTMLAQIQRRDRAVELVAAIEQAGEAIIITDRDGIVEYVNPAFERITGYSRDEAIGERPPNA